MATEDRDITPPEHVDGAGIDVHTPVGSADIVSDPSLKQVSIAAKVSAFGETDEEAKARLQDVKVKVSRRADRVLEIAADLPNLNGAIKGGCSFVVRVPEAKGIKVQTGNGSVTIKGLEGSADLDTGVGSITVADQTGNVAAKTGNGSISVAKAGGDVRAQTSVGAVTVNGARKPVSIAGEKNGTTAKTIVLKETGPSSIIRCGNGNITVTLD